MAKRSPEPMSDQGFMIRTFPGGMRWTRDPDGGFSYASFVSGGCGAGHCDAEAVAKRVLSCVPDLQSELIRLKTLGWDDVVEALTRQAANKAQEGRLLKVVSLRKQIEGLQEFVDEHRGWDYWKFRKYVWDDLVRASGGVVDENEISVRRMHYAAQHLVASPRRLEELKAQLIEVENAVQDYVDRAT